MELNQDQRNKVLIEAQKLKNERFKNALDEKNENGTYNDGYNDALVHMVDVLLK